MITVENTITLTHEQLNSVRTALVFAIRDAIKAGDLKYVAQDASAFVAVIRQTHPLSAAYMTDTEILASYGITLPKVVV